MVDHHGLRFRVIVGEVDDDFRQADYAESQYGIYMTSRPLRLNRPGFDLWLLIFGTPGS